MDARPARLAARQQRAQSRDLVFQSAHALEQAQRHREPRRVQLEIVAQPARRARHGDDARAEAVSSLARRVCAAGSRRCCTSSSSSASRETRKLDQLRQLTTRCSSSHNTSASVLMRPPRNCGADRVAGRRELAIELAFALARASRAPRSARRRTDRPRRRAASAIRARRAAASAPTTCPREPSGSPRPPSVGTSTDAPSAASQRRERQVEIQIVTGRRDTARCGFSEMSR